MCRKWCRQYVNRLQTRGRQVVDAHVSRRFPVLATGIGVALPHLHKLSTEPCLLYCGQLKLFLCFNIFEGRVNLSNDVEVENIFFCFGLSFENKLQLRFSTRIMRASAVCFVKSIHCHFDGSPGSLENISTDLTCQISSRMS